MGKQGALYRMLAVIAVVILMPVVAGWLPGASLFGFPWAAFILLLGGPLLLIALAGGSAPAGDDEPDRAEP